MNNVLRGDGRRDVVDMSIQVLTDTEIDRLVGERVMGWTFIPGAEGQWYDIAVLVATEDWSPSTDIHDAWQVLETMKNNGYSVVLQTLRGSWVCSFNSESYGMAVCETASMAICTAALKAVQP